MAFFFTEVSASLYSSTSLRSVEDTFIEFPEELLPEVFFDEDVLAADVFLFVDVFFSAVVFLAAEELL